MRLNRQHYFLKRPVIGAISHGPGAPRMQGIPGRTLVCSGRSAVTMLAKAKADFRFVIPNWPMPLYQTILGWLLPTADYHQVPAPEVIYRDVRYGPDRFRMLAKSRG
jgi:hypothetical protein